MKKRKIEKMLRKELNAITPDIYTNIAPHETSETEYIGGRTKILKKKNIIKFNAVIAALIVVFLAVWLLWPTGGGGINFGNGGFVFVDINPSVQFSIDGSGNVKKITPLNEDARILIGGKETDYTGKSAEEASAMLFKAAQSLGYFKVNKKTNALLVSSSLDNKKEEDKLNRKLSQAFKDSFVSAGIYGVVITDVKSATENSQASIYGVTPSKMRLINLAVSIGAIIEESEYSTISISEIYERIEERAEEIERFGGENILESFEQYEESMQQQMEKYGDTLEDLSEELAEYIEKNSDTIEFDKEEELENLTEKLEEISEELAERLEDGKDWKKFLEKLDTCLEEILIILPDLSVKIEQFKTDIESLLNGYDNLTILSEEASLQILNERMEKLEKNSANYISNLNKNKFEKEYEKWMEENRDYYEQHWDELKTLWETED